MKTGLVLSGGGARGIAHLGAIKALEENNITITHIAGTSAGALIGALYAAGNSWETIYDIFINTSLFNYKRIATRLPGILNTAKFYNDLAPYFKEDRYESLQTKLYITATNLISGKLEVFSKGPLIHTILASAAVPGVFTPVKMNNSLYTDGGVLNNFPVELIKDKCDTTIGIYVNPLETIDTSKLRNTYQIVNRAYQIGFIHECFNKFKDCDIMIAPDELINYGLFSLKKSKVIFEIGYNEAIKALKKQS